jgi:F-box-like
MELHSERQLLRVPRLPPELLVMIFIACADPPFGEQEPSYWQTRNMQWIVITHVCRYWRTVALECSDLWKRLRFFNPDVTKEMIRRSKGSNLEVIIDIRHRRIERSMVIPMVLPELHRVSVLHLVCSDELQSLVNGLGSAAPKLEYLDLYAPYGQSSFDIPDTIFSRETPALHSLKLRNCTITSPLPSSGTPSSPDSRIGHMPSTISQIVSCIRGAPMLHTLILNRVLPFVDTDDAYPNLVLPKLSRLELTSSIASCTNFLEHIIFPVTTDTTVICDLKQPRSDGCGRLFRAFLSVMGNRKANFVISAVTFLVMSTVGIQCTITHSHQPAPTNVTFEFVTDVGDGRLSRDIFNIASVTLPLTNAHDLDIVGFGPALVISFDSLPDIHTIRFKKCDPALELVRAALTDNKHFYQLQLRSLRSLQFSDVEFLYNVIPTLMYGLECRLLSGFPIKYIRLDECVNLKQADVMRMKEFVQDVEWDGWEYCNATGWSSGLDPTI